MPMEPRRQECHGLYLYGAGYFSRDENTLAIATTGSPPDHFCGRCPRRDSCEQAHEARVRAAMPAEVEALDERLREAKRMGIGPMVVMAVLAQRGLNPFATVAVENFNRGHAERGEISGLLVHSDVDPRRR